MALTKGEGALRCWKCYGGNGGGGGGVTRRVRGCSCTGFVLALMLILRQIEDKLRLDRSGVSLLSVVEPGAFGHRNYCEGRSTERMGYKNPTEVSWRKDF